MSFAFGVEHEVAFVRNGRNFADWTNTFFDELSAVISALPLYPSDYPQLHVGDAGIRHKRWYIEGLERFSETGELMACVPKGIEIRTTVHTEIAAAVHELRDSFVALRAVAERHGLAPVCTSFNPVQTKYVYGPPLTSYEQQLHREEPELQTDAITMLTYGPDLNLSHRGLSIDQVIDLGRKLTFYSPYIVPWSFSSPFYAESPWDGLSVRTFVRTGPRAAAHVFVEHPSQLVPGTPMLTKLARTPSEIGRIEFKAFDTCADFGRYAALLALLKGLVLDRTLAGRATTPDASLHQLAARAGFAEQQIYSGAREALLAAEAALRDDGDAALLGSLHRSLEARTTPAHALLRAYARSGSILDVLQQGCAGIGGDAAL